MREPGFEELADLWQDPDDGDREAFEALARKARRRGRLLSYVDLAFVVLLVAPLLTVFLTPNPVVVAAALVLLMATLWISLVRWRLRQMAATLNTNNPTAFVASSLRNVTANLRRVNLSLVLTPLFVAAAILFKGSQRSSGGMHLLEGVWAWASSLRGLAALAVVALFVVALIRSRARLQAELRRLESLRLEYEEERLRDEGLR